jgi:hypothetical protein
MIVPTIFDVKKPEFWVRRAKAPAHPKFGNFYIYYGRANMMKSLLKVGEV